MKTKLFATLSAVALALGLAGCDSTTYTYPMTYQIPIGSSQVTSAYGPQNLNVSASKDISVQPGVPLYYQVVSPISLTLYIFDKTGPGTGGPMLGQMQGENVTSSVTPSSGTLEFVFSAAQMNTGGTVQFTISDRPLAAAMNPAMAPTTTQTTTTQTTTTVTPATVPMH